MFNPGRHWRTRLRLLATTFLLSGCAGQNTTQTGFLTSYDGLAPTTARSDDLIFIDPTYVAGHYQKVIIEPVAWYPAPDSPARDPATIEQLKADFQKTLTDRFSKDYEIVPASTSGAAAPGVIRVRSAITNTRKANWWINAPVMVAGIGLSFVGAPGLPPPDPGGASEELEAVDAQTGRRLVAVATYNNGMPWQMVGYFKEFGHARQSFVKASDLLHEQVAPRPANKRA